MKTYFNDLGSGDPVLLLEAAALTPVGSRARMYTTDLFWLAIGDAPDVETVTPNRGGFTLCRAVTLSGAPPCSDYSGILLSADGRIATFTIDRVPLAEMVREPGSPVTAGALKATVISSYRRADGTLFVVVAVQNNGSDEQYVIGQSYADPHGRHQDAFLATTGYAIDPGATKNIGYGVPNAEFGGNLLLLSGDVQHPVTLSIPVG